MTDTGPPLAGVRIVLVNNFPGPGMGGGEYLVIAVARAARQAGAELVAVVLPNSGLGASLKDGARIVETPIGMAHAMRAVAVIREQVAGPTILVGTGYFTNLLVRQAARTTDASVVNVVAVAPGASAAEGATRASLALRKLADFATRSRVDAIVAVSSSVAEELVAGGTPAVAVRTIPNGIDVAALMAAAADPSLTFVDELELPRPLVVCAGRLAPVKGTEFLVRAVALLPDASFAFSGSGPDESRLRELTVALGVSQRVVFLGHVKSVAALLGAADVVVLPSLSEGLPMTALEAMALGRPVVASSVGGLPEAVEHGVTGLLVEPGNPEALAAGIRTVLADPQRARAMGEAGRRRVQERFTEQRMGAGYVELFAQLAARAT